MKPTKLPKDLISNRKANDWNLTETIEAGIILIGLEVKSLAQKNADLTGARCQVTNNEVFLHGSYIKEMGSGYAVAYEPSRARKLLLNKNEIKWLKGRVLKGDSVIPVKIYSKNGKFKVLLGVGRLLKKQDKREKLKEEQVKREIHE